MYIHIHVEGHEKYICQVHVHVIQRVLYKYQCVHAHTYSALVYTEQVHVYMYMYLVRGE